MATNTSTSPTHPAPLETSSDGEGRTLKVGSDSKKRQLELQAEMEHSDGPRRAAAHAEVQKEEAKSGGSNSTDPSRSK